MVRTSYCQWAPKKHMFELTFANRRAGPIRRHVGLSRAYGAHAEGKCILLPKCVSPIRVLVADIFLHFPPVFTYLSASYSILQCG